MGFTAVVGQSWAKTVLRQAMQANRLAHAYLFHGREGVGTQALAIALAQAVNCTNEELEGCGQCAACRKILAAQHPDVRVLWPGMGTVDGAISQEQLEQKLANPYTGFLADRTGHISIDVIRALEREGVYRPYEGRRKVAILIHAHRMTPEASNALLKTLEEPPVDLLLILTTDQPHRLLPTIRSRCQQVRLRELKRIEIAQALAATGQVEASKIELLARLAGGSLGRALVWADKASEVYWQWAERLIEASRDGNALQILKLAECLTAEKLGEGLERILEILQLWYRDVVTLQIVDDENLVVHVDRLSGLRAAAAHYHPQGLELALQSLTQARKELAANANAYLTFVVLVGRLYRSWHFPENFDTVPLAVSRSR